MGTEIDSLEIQIAGSVKKANRAIESLITNLDRLVNSLKIDTSGLEKIGKSLNLSDFDKAAKNTQSQSQKISKSLSQITEQYKELGKGFKLKGSTEYIQKQIDSLTNKLETAKLKKEEFEKTGKTDLGGYENAVKDVIKYTNQIESLKNQLESVNNINVQPEIRISGVNDSKKSLSEYKKELEDFKESIKSISDVYGGIENVTKDILDTPIENLKTSIEELKVEYPQATNVISDFEKELQRVQSASLGLTKEPVAVKVDIGGLEKAGNAIREKILSLQNLFKNSGKDFVFEGNSEQLEKEIQKVRNELDNLFNKQDRMIDLGKVDTDSFKGVIRDIENATNRLKILEDAKPDALNRTLEETQKKAKESEVALNGMNAKLKDLVVPQIREDNLNKLQNMLRKVEEEVDRLRAKLKNGLTMGIIKESVDDKGFQNLSAQIAVAEKRADMLRQKIQDIGGGEKTSSSLKSVSSSFSALGSVAEKVAQTIKNAFKGIIKIVSNVLSRVGRAVKSASSSITSGFSGIIKTSARAATAVKNAATKITSSFLKIGNSSKGLKSAALNLGTILKTALGFKALHGLTNFSKNAIELGSDITEVENVVDTAFGSMAGHAYAFASTAKEQFGLSELAAKQYSGTMMAMLKSSNVGQAQAAKMSTTLAGLAGDIASFYNIDTDEAFSKLRSGIAGQTMPLRSLGINMNIVNLEAFAMSRGITKAYKDMTLAEQATLRYNYILAKTTDAQGDFARTSGTWANQLRLLKLNFESISAVIGQGLIAAILPAIKWLNALMSKLMEAAKVFRSFMYTLFGKVEGSQGGIVDDLGGISDGLEEIGDTAEEVGKKINKNLLLPIDELNILSDTSDDLSDSLDGIGDFDIGDFDLGNFDDVDTTPINKWAQAIRDAFLAQDWEGLGRTIAELINKGLEWLYKKIRQITPKVEKALKNLAKVINSFIKNLDWDLLGHTIGAGINLLAKAFNALFGDEGINLELLGEKLSVGLRGMIDEIDWRELGNAIGNYLMIAWRIAYGFIEDMWRIDPNTLLTGWAEAGNALGDAIVGIYERVDFEKVSAVITEGFKGILESLTYALNTLADNLDGIVDKINLGLDRLYDGLKWDSTAGENMAAKITAFTDAVATAFNKLLDLDFGKVGQIIGAGITDIVRAFNQLTDIDTGGIDFEKIGKKISDGLRGLVTEIPWEEFGNALGNGFMLSWRILDGFLNDMAKKSAAGLTGWQELGNGIADAINGLFDKFDLSKIASAISRLVNGIFETLKQAIEKIRWKDIADNLSNGLNGIIERIHWKENGQALNNLFTELLEMLLRASENVKWEELGRGIGEFLSNIDWKGILGAVFDIIKNTLGGLIDGLKETSVGKIGLAVSGGVLAFKGFEQIIPLAELIFGPKGKIIAEIVVGIAGMVTAIGIGGKELSGAIIEMLGGLLDSAIEALNNINWEEIAKNIIDFMFDPRWYSLTGKIPELAWALVKGLANGIWENIKKITWGDIWNWILECFKELFGIHSPSTVMYEQGGFLMQGLINGLLSLSDSIISTIQGIVSDMKEAWSGMKDGLEEAWSAVETWWENNGVRKWFEESVAPWFTADKWRETYNSVKTGLQEKWSELQEWWSSTGFSDWIENNVKPWFDLQTWLDIYNSVKQGLVDKWAELQDWWSNTSFSEWIDNYVKPFFNLETWKETYNSVKQGLVDKWEELRAWWSKTTFKEWVDDHVKPWFTKEKWSDIYKNVKDSMSDTWDKMVGWWNQSGAKQWIDNNVKPWFTVEKWKDIYHSVKQGLVDKWEQLREWWKTTNFSEWIDNHVKPYFKPEEWEKTYHTIKQSLTDKWEELRSWWKSTDFSEWVDNYVKPHFTLDKWKEHYDSVKSGFESKWKELTDWWENDGMKKFYDEHIKKWFDKKTWTWDGIKEGLGESFENAFLWIKELWNGFAIPINSLLKFEIPPVSIMGKEIFGGASINLGQLPTFATGGFPEDGLFMANHGELVGRFSNGRTAVANNEQIIAGIEEAAYRGFLRAQAETSPYLADIAENTRRTAEKDMSVNIGDRDIVNAYDRGKSRNGYSFT